jgi:hypothetical protein
MNRAFFLLLLLSTILAAWSFAGEPAEKPTPQKSMTLKSFAQATINVIHEDGIAEYLPTIVLTETQEVRVIEGIPANIDHRTAVQNVVRRSSYESKEFFFGVRSASETITIGHFRPGKPTEFMTITKTSDGFSTKPLQTCDWWTIQ